MTLRATLTDLFICPISLERMTDPVMAPCGHTFEKANIDAWTGLLVATGSEAACPLCKEPITRLASNALLKQALEVLDSPVSSLASRVEDLADEEQDVINNAATRIRLRRVADRAIGIPDRLPERPSFVKKVIADVSRFYGC